jgi:hypothetical protein
MKELLLQLMLRAIPQDSTPPVKCQLLNNVKTGTSNIVGNIIGLQDLAPWIIGVLIVVAILVAAIPKLRRIVIGNLLWVLGIAIIGAAIVGAVVIFAPTHC